MLIETSEKQRGEYLLRLRERAMARLRADEAVTDGFPELQGPPTHADDDAVVMSGAPGSRRGALRLMGMAAVGVLSARAARAMSLRAAAPQYGAPSWPGGSVAFERPENVPDWLKPIAVERDHTQLAKPELWHDSGALLLPANGKTYNGYQVPMAKTKLVYFGPEGKQALAVEAIEDKGTVFILAGGHTLYVRTDDGMVGVRFTSLTIEFRRSFYSTNTGGFATAIEDFAEKKTDQHISDVLQQRVEIPMGRTIRRDDWSSSTGFVPRLTAVSATGHTFSFSIEGSPVETADWRAGKMVTAG